MIEKLTRNTIVYAKFARLSKNGNSKKAHVRQYVQHNCSYVITLQKTKQPMQDR